MLRKRSFARLVAVAVMVTVLTVPFAGPRVSAQDAATPVATPAAASGCTLNAPSGNVSHVIEIQFDNVHFTRDDPSVPSDLEQMPNLLNFIQSNGALLTNDHTPLIAHTGTNILTTLTGVYGDRHGVPVANSYRYFNPDGTTGLGVSFAYWTDPIYDPTAKTTPTDTLPNMIGPDGKIAPAPWVPFTRAGCDFGAVATANVVLENIATDLPTVFGKDAPQVKEAKDDPDLATANYVGLAIHCAKDSATCGEANGGRPDLLPDEPGGYDGYQALFGHKYVGPVISPGGPLTDLTGAPIQNPKGQAGFPGFDGMSGAVSLSYVAAMQEHGIPITYAYISDAHDAHPSGPAYGPGETGYVKALKSYDDAFGAFFARLAKDGITPQNTVFVITADEGDHFVGGAPSPIGCDGVTTPCTYQQIGEISVNLTGLLATQAGVTTPFTVHADSAPTFYLKGNPARDAAATRSFERTVAATTADNPLTGQKEAIANRLADPVEMKLLHMVTADPNRTPTFTLFAKPDYFIATGDPNCDKPCVALNPKFAWNHGDLARDVNVTWLGLIGPGVKARGIDAEIWADHTDVRPTLLALLGLKDDYASDGRALVEILDDGALPASLQGQRDTFVQLAEVYKQINAPVGELAVASLAVSTAAITSDAASDATYTQLENELASLTTDRDAVAGKIAAMLNGASFGGQAIDATQAQQLISDAKALLTRVGSLAASSPSPSASPVASPAATPGA
jgi:hypothetical protein